MTSGTIAPPLPPPPEPGEAGHGGEPGGTPAGRVLALVLLWAHLLAAVVLWAAGDGLAGLLRPGGQARSLATLMGLLASALALVQLGLIARVPFLERSYGQGELVRWHRLLSLGVVSTTVGHVAFLAAAASDGGLVSAARVLARMAQQHWALLLAGIGTLLLLLVTVTSVPPLRDRIRRYELWHQLHLAGYAAVLLSLPHQLLLGDTLARYPWARAYLAVAFITVYAAVVVFRLGLPVVRSLRYDLVVDEVQNAGGGAVSLLIRSRRGRDLTKLGFHAGQFAVWRFRDGPGWLAGHPLSLSAAPTADRLRVTILPADGSRRWIDMPKDTRVLVEGPYGQLTDAVRTRKRVVMFAAGSGITPLLALLQAREDLKPDARGPRAVLVYRVSHDEDVLHRHDLDELASRGVQVHYVVGHQSRRPGSWLPTQLQHLTDVQALLHYVPDVPDRDVFICGPQEWMSTVERAARRAGVPGQRIHLERFTW